MFRLHRLYVPIALLALIGAACEYAPPAATSPLFSECDGVTGTHGFGFNAEADPAEGASYTASAGDDVIIITNGPVTVDAGDGDDVICVNNALGTASGAVITIFGGEGNDTIVGHAATIEFCDGELATGCDDLDPGVPLPAELDGLQARLLFADDFDDQPDYANATAIETCIAGQGNGCAALPTGWTDLLVRERFHPAALADPDLQPDLQINGNDPRGGSGKSLVIWDESYGNSGQWGSDAMLGRFLAEGHNDLYVEYWIRFPAGYRWHHTELENTHGINYAKILRIGHRDEGSSPFSFSGSGSNAPLVFLDTKIWSRNQPGGGRENTAALAPQIRCDPQETNYRCDGYTPSNPVGGGDVGGSFLETYGDGGWHRVAMRVRLNSAPGVGDGVGMVWYDNALVAAAADIPFLGAGSSAETLLNQVTIGGNMHNLPERESVRFEQPYFIDDVRIYALD